MLAGDVSERFQCSVESEVLWQQPPNSFLFSTPNVFIFLVDCSLNVFLRAGTVYTQNLSFGGFKRLASSTMLIKNDLCGDKPICFIVFDL